MDLIRGAIAVLMVCVLGCATDDPTTPSADFAPGPVQNLDLAATREGDRYTLRWGKPVSGSEIIAGYEVRYFFSDSTSVVVVTGLPSTVSSFSFRPSGSEIFGTYGVKAYNDAGSSAFEFEELRRRVRSGTIHEVSAAGVDLDHAWEFSPAEFELRPRSMSNDEATSAHIYVSNFTAGVGIPPPYLFASPHMARADLGIAVVLAIAFVQDLGSAPVDLMPIAQTTFAEIIIGHYYTVRNWTGDPQYGMIYVSAVDPSDNGRVDVTTWTSSLPGSRIIGLISDPDPPPP